jgi:uncharacterized protein YjiS (DUF1127 family)
MTILTLIGASAPIGMSNSDPLSSERPTADLRKDRELHKAVASCLGRCFNYMAREYRIHCGLRAMMAFDDRMLRDIGLTRTEVESAARFGRALAD